MNKSIWIFNHYAGTPLKSPWLRHYNIAKYLIKKGYDVKVFVASTNHITGDNLIQKGEGYLYDDSEGVPYIYIKTRAYGRSKVKRVLNMFDYYQGIMRCKKLFRQPDVVIGSSVHPLACVAANKLAKKFGSKSIIEIRDLWPESIVAYGILSKNNLLIKLLYSLEKRIYSKADKIVFTMEGGSEYITSKKWNIEQGGPIKLNKISCINNGVDLAEFDFNQVNNTFYDKDLESDNTFKVIYTGSIRRVNGLSTIVEVAKKLQEIKESKVKILIYGDGDEREELITMCNSFGLSNIVFKGKVDKKFIPFILSKADLNLMQVTQTPIMKYGMSMNKTFEYLASGKPILVNFRANYCLVHQYHCGISEDIQSIDRYAELIHYFELISQDEYDTMCKNARNAAKQFDYKELAEKFIKLLE